MLLWEVIYTPPKFLSTDSLKEKQKQEQKTKTKNKMKQKQKHPI